MSRRADVSTVGILYCGDLGAAIARLLQRAGVRVVTTCEGRSRRTRERAQSAEVEILPTLDAVASVADVVVSLVLPGAATDVAREYVNRRSLCPRDSLFVDANSIDVPTLAAMDSTLAAAGIRFVDAAIHGGAKSLAELGVMYVSGRDAQDVSQVFSEAICVHSLGERVGQATRMKLLLGGLSKSLNALFLEIGILSHNADLLDEFLGEAKRFYPGIMTAIDRMLPTYPQHAARRVVELQSIEGLARSVCAPCQMVASARELLKAAAGAWHEEWQTTGEMDISRMITIAATATTHTDTGQ
ncbi:MAG: NAD(P)-binding domain-containing protein [Planctomycetota bacterium]